MNISRPLLERVALASQNTARTLSEQAHLLGVDSERFKKLREQARAAGFRVEEARPVNYTRRASRRSLQILEQMKGPPCPVDGLRGSHACTRGKIDDYARSGEAATG